MEGEVLRKKWSKIDQDIKVIVSRSEVFDDSTHSIKYINDFINMCEPKLSNIKRVLGIYDENYLLGYISKNDKMKNTFFSLDLRASKILYVLPQPGGANIRVNVLFMVSNGCKLVAIFMGF